MATRTQAHRQIALATPLGDDALLFRRGTIVEQLSRLFHMEVDVVSEKGEADVAQLLGQNVTIRLERAEKQTRYFNGIVSRISRLEIDKDIVHYRLIVSPTIWLLTRIHDCRIFQEMSVPEILQEVLKGFDVKYELKDFPPIPYCVQYRESTFNFISRLMEHAGIYYFFEHENGAHKMVITHLAVNHPAHEGSPFAYFPPTRERRQAEFISEWMVDWEVQTGAYLHIDYNFEKPAHYLSAEPALAEGEVVDLEKKLEAYYYPVGYGQAEGISKDGADAADKLGPVLDWNKALAKTRLQEHRAQHQVIRGRSDIRHLGSGFTFKFTENAPDAKAAEGEYMVTSVVHHLVSDEYVSTVGLGVDAPTYDNTFTCIPHSMQYRPPRITPKPAIQGPQTAIVTGPKGEEIFTDKYGRIKVMFHWDRGDAEQANTSCWVRVAQMWAGNKWGSFFLPRVGMEVICEFLEGDPDRPLVTGAVYASKTMPPYSLPSEKTKSTIKTYSYKGGGGFNEIRFEDKKDSEQVFIHAVGSPGTELEFAL